MALTRKMLKAMGINDEAIEQIIEAHTETVDALKAERDQLREQTGNTTELQKELEDARKQLEASANDPYKVKYDALREDFDAYKAEVTGKETKARKTDAYTALLKEAGISEKRLASVLKVSDVDGIELDENGNIKDADKLTESIKADWSDFIVSESTKGATVSTPPAQTTGRSFTPDEIRKMTPAEINANWSSIKNNLQ